MSNRDGVIQKLPENYRETSKVGVRSKQETQAGDDKVEALLLNCIDYRLVDDVVNYMNGRGLRDRYDQITLSGAAIGAMTKQRSAWGKTFWQHVALAQELHNITKVIVIDHRDCAACKTLITGNCAEDMDEEFEIHRSWMQALAKQLTDREPLLDIELWLMNLDGSVEPIELEHTAVT